MPLANGKVVRAGGFFQSGQDVNYITLTLQVGEQAFPAIFHEFSHLLVRGVFADAPLWFNWLRRCFGWTISAVRGPCWVPSSHVPPTRGTGIARARCLRGPPGCRTDATRWKRRV